VGNISVDYDVLNQKGSPAWYSDLFANIPTPGYKGRMFISTDTFAFYRDNGVGWDLVGGPGTGTITGAGVSGQLTYFIGTDVISGNNNLFYDITNGRLGINTATPGSPLDIHSTGTAAQFNGTGVNNAFVLFQNAGTSKWRIGNLYNSGANDYQIYDVLNATARLTIKNTGATTLTGTFTATSLIKSGGTSSQILLADGTTTPTSTFGAGSVTNVSAITLGTSGTDLSSSVANSTTTPVITLNVPTASATNRGALSSADWTTFNSKQSTITLTTTGTSGAATLVGATLNIPNYTNVGTVTSVAALTLGTSGTDLSSSVANSTSTPVITLNVPTASASNRGALSTTDWTTFNNKQATISVTAPVVLTGATISMPAATTSVNGYLTSTDWNTFNNKSNTNGTVTSVVALTIGTTGIDITSTAVTTTTTPVITLNIPTASASNRGALSSTDWTTFNSKQATLSLTTTGTSGAATLVANTLNVPNYGSALSGYLPLTGGTLTGALNLTYATPYIYLNGSTGNQTNLVFNINSVTKGNIVIDSSFFQLTNFTSGGWLFKNSVGSNVLTIADSGTATFTNTTTFNSYILTDNSILIKTGFNTSTSGYTGIGAVATGLTINLGTGTTGSLLFNTGASYSYTFPAATGTLALTSDLGSYLPLSGGTLTGTLNGTIANFNGVVTAGATGTNGSISIANQNGSTEVGLNIRPNQTKNGSLSFTENAVSDRWVMGIIGGDSKLYFKSASSWIGAGTTALTIDANGTSVFSQSVTLYDLLRLRSSSYGASYNTTLRSDGSAVGTLQFGNNGDNYILAGNTAAGGYLIFRVNCATESNAAGTEAFRLASNAAATFSSTIDLSGDITTTASSSTANAIISGIQFKNSANSGNVKAKIVSKNGSDSDSMGLSFQTSTSTTNISEKLLITGAGIVNATSRGNFLGATDNSLFSLNSGGTLYTVGFSPTATASSTATLTLTTGTTTWIYTGTGTATWTLPNPSGNNQIYWIKNAGTGIITLNAYSGTNIINNAAASVSSITIAVGSTAVIAQDGNVKSYQLQ